VVAEAMVCLTLADFVLDKFGGDSIAETADNLARYSAAGAAGVGGGVSGPAGADSRRPRRSGGAAPAESE
jgi:chorismate synthase